MLKIILVCVGSVKENFFTMAVDEYKKRLNRFCELSIIEVAENIANKESEVQINLEKDAKYIEKYIKGKLIICDINGRTFDSKQFANAIEKLSLSSSTLTFVIGGSNGIHSSLKQKADLLLSFSKMTFPHTLMRVIFLEQLYRSFTILGNITYHK
ncbi:MAG: 23S rRNA (pseudouridine(1915)-N(3))-methyltransferase RlmH [Clostridia bacterium]|nr:23S rRNA (pseudouridine(1915)-N(3))-methyltransferase RlmH [Clostridia bacterium]